LSRDTDDGRGSGSAAGIDAGVVGWVSEQAWLATIQVLMGLPVAILAFTVVLTLVALTAGLLVTTVLAVVTLSMLLAAPPFRGGATVSFC
jgi:hypothetical protein